VNLKSRDDGGGRKSRWPRHSRSQSSLHRCLSSSDLGTKDSVCCRLLTSTEIQPPAPTCVFTRQPGSQATRRFSTVFFQSGHDASPDPSTASRRRRPVP
jgi:hypothetical protein